MEKKQIAIYSGITLLGVAAMVATVLILRARSVESLDGDRSTMPLAKPAAGSAGAPQAGQGQSRETGVRPYTPLESLPVQRGWQEGDPPLTVGEWPAALE
jgi:hypothetical protein